MCLVLDRPGILCAGDDLPVPVKTMLARINVYTIAFLGYYAKGEKRYLPYLGSEYAADATSWIDYRGKLE